MHLASFVIAVAEAYNAAEGLKMNKYKLERLSHRKFITTLLGLLPLETLKAVATGDFALRM